jgi:hypothetical protein
MNCGLGNLDGLRKHLLPGSLGADTKFDDKIIDIGSGVAAIMEQFCNRKFARVAGDKATFQADRASFVLPRYPVEAVTAVELKLTDAEDFQAQDISFIQSTSLASGIVYLPEQADSGPYWAQVRFTYTGGFWFETLEPDDAGYPSVMPASAKALPSDLRLGWLLQVREVWNKIDKLGTGLVDTPDTQTKTGVLDLSPIVKRVLQNYVQMQPI